MSQLSDNTGNPTLPVDQKTTTTGNTEVTSVFNKWTEAPITVIGESRDIHSFEGPLYPFLTSFREQWVPTSIYFEPDTPVFAKMPEDCRGALAKLMVFFIRSENGICENLDTFDEFDSMLIKSILTAQNHMERTHAETYARQLTALFPIENERREIIEKYKDVESIIEMKMQFMKMYMTGNLLEKTFAMVLCEGILFQTSFAIIYLMNSKRSEIGPLNGVITANDYISRDEGLHCKLFAFLFKNLKLAFLGVDNNDYKGMIEKAKEVEYNYVKFVLADKHLLGYTLEDFKVYIDYIGAWIEELVFEKPNTKKHNFKFMVDYNSLKKVIQFEVENVNYISVGNTISTENLKKRQLEIEGDALLEQNQLHQVKKIKEIKEVGGGVNENLESPQSPDANVLEIDDPENTFE